MIQEITKERVKNIYCVFPKITIKTEIGDKFKTNSMLIRSHVRVADYLIMLSSRRSYKVEEGFDYKNLMQFVDNFMVLVNSIKDNFKPDRFEGNDGLIIYKIIE